MTYSEALAKLNGKASKSTGQRGTKLVRVNATYSGQSGADYVGVLYHDTTVLRIYRSGVYELNSGGWRTNTTKSRINEYCPAQITQKRGEWTVALGKQSWIFVDGMTINAEGVLV